MLDPSGQPMCRMAAKRGRWYLAKGLASLLPEGDPLAAQAPGRTIRLHFEPGGPGNAAEPWLLAGKRNACVGCGGEAGGGGEGRGGDGSRCGADGAAARLVRFSVVPHAFRRHLPDPMKSRDSHDLVVLCVGCYGVLEPAYERHRQHLYRRRALSRCPLPLPSRCLGCTRRRAPVGTACRGAPRRGGRRWARRRRRPALPPSPSPRTTARGSPPGGKPRAARRAACECGRSSPPFSSDQARRAGGGGGLGAGGGAGPRHARHGRRLGAAACAWATASGARLAVARGAADARRPFLAGRRQRRRRRRRRRRRSGHAPRFCARVAGGLL